MLTTSSAVSFVGKLLLENIVKDADDLIRLGAMRNVSNQEANIDFVSGKFELR